MALSKVIKRDGRIVDFQTKKISDAISKALLAVGEEGEELAHRLAEEVTREAGTRFKDKPPTVEDIQDMVEQVLIDNKHAGAAKAYILYRGKRAELREAKKFFGVKDDLKLGVNAVKVLERRYLLKDENGRVIETPSEMLRRVAKTVASVEKKYDKDSDVKEWEEAFYDLMSNFLFLPNSPTLMNAGTSIGQLSACFVIPVEDSMKGIFEAVKDMALIHQSGGGTGFSFSRLRPRGDVVRSTHGIASGPVSFMKVFDAATEVIKQGGRRRGANMGILVVDHPDIIEFMTVKENEAVLTNFNISVGVTDDFMTSVEKDEKYPLINPRTGAVATTVRARDIFDLIATMAWRTGDPGIVFLDRINKANPTPQVGVMESTNPCVAGDAWLHTDEGPRQVKELIGRSFSTWVEGRYNSSSAKGFFKTGYKEVFRLVTREGHNLRLTADHPVKLISKLTRTQLISTWKRVGELKKGDMLLLNNHSLGVEWKGPYNWEDGGEGIEDVMDRAYHAAMKLPHRSDFKGWTEVSNRGEWRMSLGHIKSLAENLGMKPGHKTITPELEKSSSDFYKGFIRGLFDADGSVQGTQKKGLSVRLAQSDLSFLEAVQRMLLRLGVVSMIYRNRRRSGFSTLPDGRGGAKEYRTRVQHELVISRDNIRVFQGVIGFSHGAKARRLEDALKNYRRRLNRERFITRFESLSSEGYEDVYDVQVPGVNAFDANGLVVHNCGEQPLLPFESCNLGSINLSRMVKKGKIDFEKLASTINLSVRFLDNVIDAGRFPLKEIEKMTKANRKIGLGVMGFAEMLIQLGIPYDTDEAVETAEELMRFITEKAVAVSVELGEERGSFPNFPGSVWEKRGLACMRNATLTTIAPTGTISIIANTTSGIEPLFAVSFIRNVMEGTKLLEVNPFFEEVAKREGFYSKELMIKLAKIGSVKDLSEIPDRIKGLFATALDIAPQWHVKMQAAFQKYVDNAVSKTVNLPGDATIEDVRKIYRLAYDLGCKGITVYRYGSKSEQVLSIRPAYVKEELEEGHIMAESEFAGGCPTGECF